MKNLIKFLKKTILFSGLIIIFYPVFIIMYGELTPQYFKKNLFYEKFAYGFSYTRFQEVKKTKNIDILFLGSSKSYRHYDPRIFKEAGFTSFNLGSSSQTFIQTEILVNRYLDSLKPKFVVLDVYPKMFSSAGVESSFDLISNDYNDWKTLEMALELKNIMLVNTWIYAKYKEYFWGTLNDTEPKVDDKNTYIPGGYVKREIATHNQEGRVVQPWKLNGKQWESFQNILNKLKKSSARILIIHSPTHRGIQYIDTNTLEKYLKSEELDYYNYKNLNFIKDSLHFYEPPHLNQNGVELYNRFLLEKHF